MPTNVVLAIIILVTMGVVCAAVPDVEIQIRGIRIRNPILLGLLGPFCLVLLGLLSLAIGVVLASPVILLFFVH